MNDASYGSVSSVLSYLDTAFFSGFSISEFPIPFYPGGYPYKTGD